jgi:hypothetical protein
MEKEWEEWDKELIESLSTPMTRTGQSPRQFKIGEIVLTPRGLATVKKVLSSSYLLGPYLSD